MKKWDIPWLKLTREEQDRYLTILWRDGYTEQAIADFFEGATKGRIVRRRQTGLHLSSEGRGKVKSTVEYGRFVDLLEIDKMDEMVERGGGNVVCFGPIESTCRWPLASGGSLKETKLCGKPTLPGKDKCEEHEKAFAKLLGKH